MILVFALAALVSCDPVWTTLFTPEHPRAGAYTVCTADQPLEEVVAGSNGVQFGAPELLDPLDAFGTAGTYNRPDMARLYAGLRVRVVHGWKTGPSSFESVTVISPYPDPTLTRLMPGTLVITWTGRNSELGIRD